MKTEKKNIVPEYTLEERNALIERVLALTPEEVELVIALFRAEFGQ